MGGHSSGQYRTRNRGTVDSSIRLDIRDLRRRGFVKAHCIATGTLRWTWTATGQERGSVGVTVNLTDGDAGFLVARFNLNGEPRVQEIAIVSAPMRYGGRRYYFECPCTLRRSEVLPMVGGVFASRQAHRLTYQSQSGTYLDRLRDKAWKLEKRLWPEPGKPRPRGRNRERLFAAWVGADGAFNDLFGAEARRRFGYLF